MDSVAVVCKLFNTRCGNSSTQDEGVHEGVKPLCQARRSEEIAVWTDDTECISVAPVPVGYDDERGYRRWYDKPKN
jgi:hypothetical protein